MSKINESFTVVVMSLVCDWMHITANDHVLWRNSTDATLNYNNSLYPSAKFAFTVEVQIDLTKDGGVITNNTGAR